MTQCIRQHISRNLEEQPKRENFLFSLTIGGRQRKNQRSTRTKECPETCVVCVVMCESSVKNIVKKQEVHGTGAAACTLPSPFALAGPQPQGGEGAQPEAPWKQTNKPVAKHRNTPGGNPHRRKPLGQLAGEETAE